MLGNPNMSGHDEIRTALRARGLRVTPQRLAILSALQALGRHATAEEVLERVHGTVPGVSLPTVYAGLELLADLGLATRVRAGRAVRFDPRVDPHHHFVCDNCGAVADLDAAVDLEPALAGCVPRVWSRRAPRCSFAAAAQRALEQQLRIEERVRAGAAAREAGCGRLSRIVSLNPPHPATDTRNPSPTQPPLTFAGRTANAKPHTTSASTIPSHPLTPTVWMPVATSRGSAATASTSRRTPTTRGSSLSASTTAPPRTMLSATISVPGRERSSASAR